MRFCVYQYSTEDAYCEKLLLIYFSNLLLFLSLYIDFVMAKLFTVHCNIPLGRGFPTTPNISNSFKYLNGYNDLKN